MATPAKPTMPPLTAVLPESYTLETGSGILQQQGVHLRHKDLSAELNTKESTYKQLLHLPALIIYNQSLVDRASNADEYLQEQIVNVIFAVNEVRAKYPENNSPLSAKRLDEYDKIQLATQQASEQVIEFAKIHEELKEEVSHRLKAQIKVWVDLCDAAADKLTEALVREKLSLPDNFREILSKHLQRAGTNRIRPEELSEMKWKGKLSYAEQALLCALKEVT